MKSIDYPSQLNLAYPIRVFPDKGFKDSSRFFVGKEKSNKVSEGMVNTHSALEGKIHTLRNIRSIFIGKGKYPRVRVLGEGSLVDGWFGDGALVDGSMIGLQIGYTNSTDKFVKTWFFSDLRIPCKFNILRVANCIVKELIFCECTDEGVAVSGNTEKPQIILLAATTNLYHIIVAIRMQPKTINQGD